MTFDPDTGREITAEVCSCVDQIARMIAAPGVEG